jgi:hypothetical protein
MGGIRLRQCWIEGYGWGALNIHLLMRSILGLHEEEVDRLTVHPILPHTLRRPGATYQVQPIPWGGYTLRLSCTVIDAQKYMLRLRCVSPVTEAKLHDIQQETQEYQCEWEG